jgi:hypothetical protein
MLSSSCFFLICSFHRNLASSHSKIFCFVGIWNFCAIDEDWLLFNLVVCEVNVYRFGFVEEELFDAFYSIRFKSYQRKLGNRILKTLAQNDVTVEWVATSSVNENTKNVHKFQAGTVLPTHKINLNLVHCWKWSSVNPLSPYSRDVSKFICVYLRLVNMSAMLWDTIQERVSVSRWLVSASSTTVIS